MTAHDAERVSSEPTRLECRVKPLLDHDETRLAEFARYFESPFLEMLQLSREVLERATAIRAEYGFSTPDPMHLAAALVGRCEISLTNDRRLARSPGIRIAVISAL